MGNIMSEFRCIWTDGNNEAFQIFYVKTEEYYSKIVGGKEKRKAFIPYNLSQSIEDVLIVYDDVVAVGCAGLKSYSDDAVEIKRVWVEPTYRGKHIAAQMMDLLEERAKERGFRKIILQTRPIMQDAVKLYESRGYTLIDNYPPYDKLDGAICMAKMLD